MRRLLLLLGVLSLLPLASVSAAPSGDCANAFDAQCHSVTADQAAGDFHGLIMVPGQPGILDIATHSGSKPGCGDCVWTLVIACVLDTPVDPHNQIPCNGAGGSPKCADGQSSYRLFLATDTEANHLVATLCLGGPSDVVPVTDVAAADVDRYLKDVTPPKLQITTQPPKYALASIPTFFQVSAPAFPPQTFGGPQVTETITIKPSRYTWHWGDGTPPLRTDDPGAPYPDGHVTHTYIRAAHVSGLLTTEWSATYTITAGGQTLGPFDATGTVQRSQPFTLVVDRARSHLVSHG